MSLLRKMSALLIIGTLGFVGSLAAPSPAQAANTIVIYRLDYGNSYVNLKLTWAGRSVLVEGTVKTTDGNCRQAEVESWINAGLDGEAGPTLIHGFYNEGTVCSQTGQGSKYESFTHTLKANNIRGNVDYLNVCIRGKGWMSLWWEFRRCGRTFNPNR